MSTELATFAGGCFWCTEAIFQRLRGVSKVTSGYTGGKVANPSYEQVSSGTSGHAEALQIEFDPAVITYPALLEIFFATIDPTTLNRQGNDTGTQYRSAVFYHNGGQKNVAEGYISDHQKDYSAQIVTTVEPASEFYPAEDYHQNYYNSNSSQPYCQFVINPKLQKLREKFSAQLSPNA